jgi:hypothetical protein
LVLALLPRAFVRLLRSAGISSQSMFKHGIVFPFFAFQVRETWQKSTEGQTTRDFVRTTINFVIDQTINRLIVTLKECQWAFWKYSLLSI